MANGRNCGYGMMRRFDKMIGHSDLAVRTAQGIIGLRGSRRWRERGGSTEILVKGHFACWQTGGIVALE